MKSVKLIVLVLVLSLVSTAAWAQRFEITPFAGYRTSGRFDLAANVLDYGNLKINDGFAYGLSLGFRVNEFVTVEGMWSHTSTRFEAELGELDPISLFDISQDQFHLNFLFFLDKDVAMVRPYVLLGLGWTSFNPKPDKANTETRFSWGMGGGFVAMFSDMVGLRLQAKWIPTYVNTTSALFIDYWGYPWIVPVDNYMSQWEFTGGLVFRF
jgi:opacity protein-like surface antigen